MKVKSKRVKQHPFDLFEIPKDPDRRKDAFDDLLFRYIRNNPDRELTKYLDTAENRFKIARIETDENGNLAKIPVSFKDICNAEKTCISKPIVTDVTYADIPDRWIDEYLETCDAIPEIDPVEEGKYTPLLSFVAGLTVIILAALAGKTAIHHEVKV